MQQGPQKIFPLMLIRVAGLPSQQMNALSGFPMKTPADAQAAQVQQAFDKALKDHAELVEGLDGRLAREGEVWSGD